MCQKRPITVSRETYYLVEVTVCVHHLQSRNTLGTHIYLVEVTVCVHHQVQAIAAGREHVML